MKTTTALALIFVFTTFTFAADKAGERKGAEKGSENAEIIETVRSARHALIVVFKEGKVQSIDVQWTLDDDALRPIMKRMQKIQTGRIDGRKFLCFNDILDPKGVRIGLSCNTYDIDSKNCLILPEPPFLFRLDKNSHTIAPASPQALLRLLDNAPAAK
jgi:hypothetical protein